MQGVEYRFERPALSEEIEISGVDYLVGEIPELVTRYGVGGLGQEEPFPEHWIDRPELVTEGALDLSKFRKLICTRATMSHNVWKPVYEAVKGARENIIRDLEIYQGFLSMGNAQEQNNAALFGHLFPRGTDEWQRKLQLDLKDALKLYRGEFALTDYAEYMAKSLETHVVLLEGLSRAMQGRSTYTPENLARMLAGAKSGMVPGGVVACVSQALRNIGELLDAVFPLGPFRKAPERWYVYGGTDPADVGFSGELLPSLLFRTPSLLSEVNDWLRRLDIGYEIQVSTLGKRERDLFELRLIDARRSEPLDVSLRDVGFGISQILPFVVQCVVGEYRIITIEQPEVHIHPRLQADLGEILAEAIQGPGGNQLIVETHSEHLVLRIQKLVRQGRLRPQQVSVLFVSREPEGSCVKRLHLDDQGEFIDDWPGGFFAERLKELL